MAPPLEVANKLITYLIGGQYPNKPSFSLTPLLVLIVYVLN